MDLTRYDKLRSAIRRTLSPDEAAAADRALEYAAEHTPSESTDVGTHFSSVKLYRDLSSPGYSLFRSLFTNLSIHLSAIAAIRGGKCFNS